MKLGLGKWNLCYFLTIKSSHITTKAIFRDFIEHFWSWVARDEGCLELGKSGGVEKKYRASTTEEELVFKNGQQSNVMARRRREENIQPENAV